MEDALLVREDAESFELILSFVGSFVMSLSRFSPAVFGMVPEFPRSREVPGVRGVFADDPKEAKAPDPRPKAEDAPGEAVFAVFKGEIVLATLSFPFGVSPAPKRLDVAYGREESVLVLSLELVDGLERESLVELQ